MRSALGFYMGGRAAFLANSTLPRAARRVRVALGGASVDGAPRVARIASRAPDSLLAEYEGACANADGFVREVRRDGQRLMIGAAAGAPIAYRAVTPASFHAERGDGYVVFGRDASGRVAYLELLQPSAAERFERRR